MLLLNAGSTRNILLTIFIEIQDHITIQIDDSLFGDSSYFCFTYYHISCGSLFEMYNTENGEAVK